MEYIQVKNWKDFQHYNDRTPPWIKLYNHLLDDFEFSCLPDASKAHLLSIWLLASRTNNKIPCDVRWISNKINATENVDIDLLLASGFIEKIPSKINELHTTEQDASIELHKQEQDACLEREERERREREDKSKQSRFTRPCVDEINSYMQERGFDSLQEAENFFDFYESKGWMVGKNKMKDWKAAVRNWLKDKKPQQKQNSQSDKPDFMRGVL